MAENVGGDGDFNPHSPCGERRLPERYPVYWFQISIHTPLAGSDEIRKVKMLVLREFQSTLPLRGATAEMRHF